MKHLPAILFAIAQTVAADGRHSVENLALGKPCTLDPKPNDALCSDPGDQAQLTDGVYPNVPPGVVRKRCNAAVDFRLSGGCPPVYSRPWI
ncbi:MAG: hypothetical protein KA004_13905 [Verrucomicrobiales bacterium]|nr:hypothetical protein [Verrucomicrobiales bacterium]